MGPSRYKKSFFNKNFDGVVDSIYLGFFFTEELKLIGGFNTELNRKQDIDLFKRLKRSTGKNLFISSQVNAIYILKHDSFKSIIRRSYIQGFYAGSDPTNIRFAHLIPFVALTSFVFALILVPKFGLSLMLVYFIVASFMGFMEIRKSLSIPIAILIFPLVHIAYTTGNTIGLSCFFFNNHKANS